MSRQVGEKKRQKHDKIVETALRKGEENELAILEERS